MRAYIVVATEPGRSRDIARQIAGLPGVKMADACWGSRDVVAVVEVRGSQELNKLVMDQIQRLVGVRETNKHPYRPRLVVFRPVRKWLTSLKCPINAAYRTS